MGIASPTVTASAEHLLCTHILLGAPKCCLICWMDPERQAGGCANPIFNKRRWRSTRQVFVSHLVCVNYAGETKVHVPVSDSMVIDDT